MNRKVEIRGRIEAGFTELGHSLFRFGKIVILLIAAVQIFLIFQIPDLNIDTSTEGMLHEKDPELLKYNLFRDEFGRDDLLMVTVRTEGNLITPDNIEILGKLHGKLSDEVSFLDEVNSLINARDVEGVDGCLIVDDLFASLPQSSSEWSAMEGKILKDPMYRNFIVSEDGRLGVILLRTMALIPDEKTGSESDTVSPADAEEVSDPEDTADLEGFDDLEDLDGLLGGFEELSVSEEEPSGSFHYITDGENSRMIRETEQVLEEFRAGYGGRGMEFSYVGTPAMTEILKRKMISSILKFMILIVLVIAVLLALLFRQPAGVILPLMVAGFSISGTLGIMSLAGVSLKIPTQILPSFLVSVSIGASIHILSIFFRFLKQGESREGAIARAMGHSGLAVTMTSLTTMGGLLSFAGSRVAPISDLGIFASLGVLLSLVFTTFLLPSVLSFIPLKGIKKMMNVDQEKRAPEVSGENILNRVLAWIARFSCRRAGSVAIVSGLVLVVFLGLSFMIVFGHDVLSWLPQDMEYIRTTKLVDKRMKGSAVFEIVADTGTENGIYDPVFLDLVERIDEPLESAAADNGLFIGKTLSVADLLKETHQALNDDDPGFYRIPDTREAVAQELLLFENSGSDDLSRLTDTIYSKARITVKVPWADGLIYGSFLRQAEENLNSHFAGQEITVTGLIPILGGTLSAVIASTRQSYVLAYIFIALLMLVFIGDLKLGILSMLPNVFPVIVTLGIMGIAGIVLDMFTMLIGSIAIGLAVDDTIHFMHNYNRLYRETGDSDGAVYETLMGTGRAMLSTTIALTAGFFVLYFSDMRNLHYFGLLTGFTLITALAADFFMAPALVTLLDRRKRRKSR